MLTEVGKTDEESIERAEYFVKMLKRGQIKGFMIIAPLHGDTYKWWAGGDWVSVEMVGRLMGAATEITLELRESSIDGRDGD